MPRKALQAPEPNAETSKTLTALQTAFVEAYLTNGGNGAAAAREIGIKEDQAAQRAYTLLRHQGVQRAIYERMASEVAMTAPKALGTIRSLMSSARSEFVKLQAAQDVLDRAGIRAQSNTQSAGEITVRIDLGG